MKTAFVLLLVALMILPAVITARIRWRRAIDAVRREAEAKDSAP